MFFVSCFLSGLFLTALGERPNGFSRLYEDMMMVFCFLYFLFNPQRFCVEWCSELLQIQVDNSFWIRWTFLLLFY